MPVTIPMDAHHAPALQPATRYDAKTLSDHGHKGAAAAHKTPARTVRTIAVGAGDSIYSIARREHSSVAAIAKANPKLNTRQLVPGTKIRVPGPHAPAKTAHEDTAKALPRPMSARHTYAPKPTQVVTYAGTDAAKAYPSDVVASGDAHRKQLAQENLPTRDEIHTKVVATAKRYGVSPTLALGIAWQESGFQQSAVSVCDAVGTMQVMPSTGEWASHIVGKKLDILKTDDNITAGVTTLRYLTTHAKDQDEAIGAYYEGLGAMQEHGPYSDTKQYITSVKSHMARFSRS